MYLADQLQTDQNKLVFNYGLRFQSTTFNLQHSAYLASQGVNVPDAYTTKTTDPRLGLTYTPIPDLTFRTSYTVNSQRPDMRRLQRLGPGDLGDVGTASSAADLVAEDKAASNYGVHSFNRLSLSHSHDFDLGVEKGFRAPTGPLEGSYSASLTGYNKWVNNLAFLNAPNYAAYPFVHTAYDNEGKEKASGFEFQFRKIQRHPSDWSGYVSYTNQVVRTNSSYYDTAYIPYAVLELASSGAFTEGQLQGLARQQFAPSWDQRHTVGVVATKRLNKLFETTFILDAGSGLPFFPGATSSGGGNFGAVGAGFAEITGLTTGGAGDFTNVPISDRRGQAARPQSDNRLYGLALQDQHQH